MPRHIVRLILLMVGFACVGIWGEKFFTVNSFYQYGHYRGNSVADIASDKPKYKGTAYCASCHAEQIAEWSNGVHNRPDIGKVVRCEVCHGAGGERDVRGMFENSSTGPDHPKNLKMVVPTDTRKLCTLCHERMTGRPLQQRQIVVAEHAGTQQCTVCHNPHSPRLNLVSRRIDGTGRRCGGGQGQGRGLRGLPRRRGRQRKPSRPHPRRTARSLSHRALKAYITGARSDPMMSAGAQGLSDDDAANIAAYFAGVKCESSLDAAKQATLPGKATAAKCTACHGADGSSTNPSWPNLVGQSKAYLVNALKAYKGGARKNGMMAGVVKDLSDADMENVAAYYANATCK